MGEWPAVQVEALGKVGSGFLEAQDFEGIRFSREVNWGLDFLGAQG